MDHYYATGKPIDEGMYADDGGTNFDDLDDEMAVGSGEAVMRIDSSSATGFAPHHFSLMATEKIVHTDFFNDFGDLYDPDSFSTNTATTLPTTA